MGVGFVFLLYECFFITTKAFRCTQEVFNINGLKTINDHLFIIMDK